MSEVPFERKRSVGRYTILGAIASGGMASVHLGRLQGTGGFARTVAIKRLHPGLAKDSQLVTMLLDEARTSARVQHPNVVSTLDVVEDDGEVLLVLEYVHGESLANLLGVAARADAKPPVEVVAAIVAGALRGLHAAHEARDERGMLLGLVHRDVSPQNILVDTNGNARLLDFGVAKACGRQQISQVGILKGKVAYMAPEQVHGSVSRRSDVFSMGIVLWESLTGEHLFQGRSDGETLAAVMMAKVPLVRSKVPSIPQTLDDVVLRSVRRLPDDRFATALDFAQALEASVSVASPARVASWLQELAGETLAKRERLLLTEESAAAPPVASARPWLRSRTFLAAGAALALLGLGMLAARRTPAPDPKPMTVVAPPTAAPEPASVPSKPEETEPTAAESTIASDNPAPQRVPGSRRRAAQGARGRCDPPYTLDAKGRKMYKRYCF